MAVHRGMALRIACLRGYEETVMSVLLKVPAVKIRVQAEIVDECVRASAWSGNISLMLRFLTWSRGGSRYQNRRAPPKLLRVEKKHETFLCNLVFFIGAYTLQIDAPRGRPCQYTSLYPHKIVLQHRCS